MRIEFLIELRLTRQHNLQQFLLRRFQVGQKPDLFQYFRRQVVSLVHHQDGRQFLLMSLQQEAIQDVNQLVFGFARDRQPEIKRDVTHEFQRRKRGIENQGEGHIAALQQPQQRAQNERLSGANLARQNYESAVRCHSVIQRSERFVVPRRGKQKRRVRRDFERISLQLIEALVHDFYPYKYVTADPIRMKPMITTAAAPAIQALRRPDACSCKFSIIGISAITSKGTSFLISRSL